MNVIIGMEESQEICKAFRLLGHDAFSCDLQPCSGGHPEWHIQDDIFKVIKSKVWDMGIFHPVCTYLTVSNNGPMKHGCNKYTAEEGKELRRQAIADFMQVVECNIPLKAIENPIGIMSTIYRKPDQYIQPYDYGEDASKNTCLWLTGLNKLIPTHRINGRIINGIERFSNQTDTGQNRLAPSETRAKERSKTYPGIAQAMANQWSKPQNKINTLF